MKAGRKSRLVGRGGPRVLCWGTLGNGEPWEVFEQWYGEAVI